MLLSSNHGGRSINFYLISFVKLLSFIFSNLEHYKCQFRLSLFVITGSRSYQTLFLRKHIIFPFFVVKLGHSIVNTTFFICYKHSSFRVSENVRKTKFGRIDSWFACYKRKNHHKLT